MKKKKTIGPVSLSTILDGMKKEITPPPSPKINYEFEIVRKAKRAISPSLKWGGGGGEGRS